MTETAGTDDFDRRNDMDYYAFSNEKIASELGQRLRRLRLRRGFSKQQMADAIGQPLDAIAALETGKGNLELFVAVMRELRAFDQLDRFLVDSRAQALELKDPPQTVPGTVTYRRRRSDFKPSFADKGSEQPRRKTDQKSDELIDASHLAKDGTEK